MPGYNNFLSFLNALIDTILVSQNVCIAAENTGCGICYLGTTLYNADAIIEILKLPLLTFPVTTLALGWPDENPSINDRLPLNGILHHEVYQEYNLEVIDNLYKVKESLPENLKYVIENKVENLAQVFTDFRYTMKDNFSYSDALMKILRKQGFFPEEF